MSRGTKISEEKLEKRRGFLTEISGFIKRKTISKDSTGPAFLELYRRFSEAKFTKIVKEEEGAMIGEISYMLDKIEQTSRGAAKPFLEEKIKEFADGNDSELLNLLKDKLTPDATLIRKSTDSLNNLPSQNCEEVLTALFLGAAGRMYDDLNDQDLNLVYTIHPQFLAFPHNEDLLKALQKFIWQGRIDSAGMSGIFANVTTHSLNHQMEYQRLMPLLFSNTSSGLKKFNQALDNFLLEKTTEDNAELLNRLKPKYREVVLDQFFKEAVFPPEELEAFSRIMDYSKKILMNDNDLYHDFGLFIDDQIERETSENYQEFLKIQRSNFDNKNNYKITPRLKEVVNNFRKKDYTEEQVIFLLFFAIKEYSDLLVPHNEEMEELSSEASGYYGNKYLTISSLAESDFSKFSQLPKEIKNFAQKPEIQLADFARFLRDINEALRANNLITKTEILNEILQFFDDQKDTILENLRPKKSPEQQIVALLNSLPESGNLERRCQEAKEMVALLDSENVNLFRSKSQHTPLHFVAKFGQPKDVEDMILLGSDINARAIGSKTATKTKFEIEHSVLSAALSNHQNLNALLNCKPSLETILDAALTAINFGKVDELKIILNSEQTKQTLAGLKDDTKFFSALRTLAKERSKADLFKDPLSQAQLSVAQKRRETKPKKNKESEPSISKLPSPDQREEFLQRLGSKKFDRDWEEKIYENFDESEKKEIEKYLSPKLPNPSNAETDLNITNNRKSELSPSTPAFVPKSPQAEAMKKNDKIITKQND